MSFKIVDTFSHDGQFCLKVEHYNSDGSFWFIENYTFQGREGLRHKREVDNQGRVLMDNGQPAPMSPNAKPTPFLPPGRTWAYRPEPYLAETSILTIIKSVHEQRLVTGWPQGRIDVMGPFKPEVDDSIGSDVLLGYFSHLEGQVFTL